MKIKSEQEKHAIILWTEMEMKTFLFTEKKSISNVPFSVDYYRCSLLGVLSALLLFIDVGFSSEKEAVMSLPAWKLFTVTTAVVSFSLKILSTTQVKESITVWWKAITISLIFCPSYVLEVLNRSYNELFFLKGKQIFKNNS